MRLYRPRLSDITVYVSYNVVQSLGIEKCEAVDSPDSSDVAYQKWVGKDYYNPFIKDFIELNKPHQGILKVLSYHILLLMLMMHWDHSALNRASFTYVTSSPRAHSKLFDFACCTEKLAVWEWNGDKAVSVAMINVSVREDSDTNTLYRTLRNK